MRARNKRMRAGRSLAMAAALGLALTGCVATSIDAGGNCSPGHTISNAAFGRVSAQQAGRGSSISWGVYTIPQYKSASFVLTVYAGGVKIDAKNQNYEPHGSVNAARALKYSGKQFVINGAATSNGDVLTVHFVCTIA
jgi:hypothetical protein